MLNRRHRERGFNIIELLIGLVVVAVLVVTGLPSLRDWIQNSHIRTAAEGLQSGLNLARAEALRRNSAVRFSLVTSLTSGCALSTTGRNWVVSVTDPTGACEVDPSDTTAPQIVQKKASEEGTANAVLTATGGSTVIFSGLGRLITTGPAPFTRIDITNPTGGACVGPNGVGGGPMRCLRLAVTSGGQIRMCDPAVTDNSDPRFC